MLPKTKRLTKEDFKKNRQKFFFRGELFDVSYIPLPSQKFACVISKKTLNKAVDRNTTRRRVYNSLHAYIKEEHHTTPYSLIFYPKKTLLTTPYQQLYNEIKKVFDTLH